ncbi:uncharacterized protein BN646_00619 [Parabacteroides sp. CAG:409]|nr:uncharacterized protein BN646_00619 [Parabacteroides sp. CAG:409]
MEDITIQDLIIEQSNRIHDLIYHDDNMIPYYDFPNMKYYYQWIEKAKRFLELNYPNDKHITDFEELSKKSICPDQQEKMLAILEAFAVLPIAIPRIKLSPQKQNHERGPIQITTNINNSNSQTQNQQQMLAVELFLEAIKDDLTGHQIKELKAVVAEADNDIKKARAGIIEKLKSFGADITSNIVANLLTNITIWNGLLNIK